MDMFTVAALVKLASLESFSSAAWQRLEGKNPSSFAIRRKRMSPVKGRKYLCQLQTRNRGSLERKSPVSTQEAKNARRRMPPSG